jgi:hypothetical protein
MNRWLERRRLKRAYLEAVKRGPRKPIVVLPPPPSLLADNWQWQVMRVGRKVGRTLYLNDQADQDGDGQLVGLADTPALAAEIAERWNQIRDDRL